MKNIYQFQYETEEKDDEFAKWLNYLDAIVGPDFQYLNPRGVIPREAINAGPDKAKGKGGQPKKQKDGQGQAQQEDKTKEQKQTQSGVAEDEMYQESDDEEGVEE